MRNVLSTAKRNENARIHLDWAGPMKASLGQWSRGPDVLLALPLGVVLAIGVAFATAELGPMMLLAGVALLPLLLWLLDARPVLLLALFCGAQAFEGVQYNSPVGSVTLGIVMLLLLLSRFGGAFLAKLRSSPQLRLGAGFLLLWIATYGLRITYEEPAAVAREMVTVTSFFAVFAVGAAFADRPDALRSVAYGAAAALALLGFLGALASIGVVPMPARAEGARTFFGISSPFSRNYGIDVPYDAVALLGPLCIPYLLLSTARAGRTRSSAAILLLAVSFSCVLVFQARGLIFQIILTAVAAPVLMRPGRALLVVPVAAVLLFGLLGGAAQTDEVSSRARSATNEQVIVDAASRPGRFVLGQDANAYFQQVLREESLYYALAAAFEADEIPIHNFFFSNLVGGGWLAFLALMGAYVTMLVTAYRRWRAKPDDLRSQVLLAAAGLVTFESLVEPVLASIVGVWLVMGLVLGRAPAESDAGRLAEPVEATRLEPATAR
jgi:hypothetical protein